jgi:hypothetical protein
MPEVSLLVVTALATVSVACGSDSPTVPSSPTVTAVTVSGTSPLVGGVAQFTATAALVDGSSRPVTAEATWQSSNTSVATVNGGTVSGVGPGEADISASYQNATGRLHIAIAATPCTFSVSPSTVTIPAAGGTARISVFAGTNCGWSAASSEPFVTITSGGSGTGNGATSISVSANAGPTRSAVLTIAGRPVTISQRAGNCVTSVSSSSVEYPAELKQGTLTVTAPADCQWTASSSVSFISLPTFGASGNGNGSFTYRVFGNLTGAPRSGSITVLQQSINLTQQAPLGGNSLSFVSDAGDYIGQGWTLLLQAPTSTFTPTISAGRNHLSVRIVGSDSLRTLDWSLNLMAPQGQQLVPGTYLNATRWPFQAPTVPGLDFSGDGRGCNTLRGEFTITRAVYGGDNSVQQLEVTFEQHCEGAGPALRGQILYVR